MTQAADGADLRKIWHCSGGRLCASNRGKPGAVEIVLIRMRKLSQQMNGWNDDGVDDGGCDELCDEDAHVWMKHYTEMVR